MDGTNPVREALTDVFTNPVAPAGATDKVVPLPASTSACTVEYLITIEVVVPPLGLTVPTTEALVPVILLDTPVVTVGDPDTANVMTVEEVPPELVA